MSRQIRTVGAGLGLVLLIAGWAQAQVPDVIGVDPPGYTPGRGLGWRISNGFGYGAIGPRGPGYYTGLYTPTFSEDGQSPAYSPIFNSLNAGPGTRAYTSRYAPPATSRGHGLLGRLRRR
jgi:hypothetical protein